MPVSRPRTLPLVVLAHMNGGQGTQWLRERLNQLQIIKDLRVYPAPDEMDDLSEKEKQSLADVARQMRDAGAMTSRLKRAMKARPMMGRASSSVMVGGVIDSVAWAEPLHHRRQRAP